MTFYGKVNLFRLLSTDFRLPPIIQSVSKGAVTLKLWDRRPVTPTVPFPQFLFQIYTAKNAPVKERFRFDSIKRISY